MQNHQSDVRRAGQLVPPAAFLEVSRVQPIAARTKTGWPVERLAESPNMIAHDARNLISALYLCCELLASPGVLSAGFAHYADDLNRLAGSGARLIEALAVSRTGLSSRLLSDETIEPAAVVTDYLRGRRHPFPGIEDLSAELGALEQPLRALAGPEVRVEVECMPCSGRLALNSEDLFRILFNLVANAVESLASTPAELRRRPFVRITAQRGGAASFLTGRDELVRETVVLSVRDNGPGIAARDLPRIFDNGFSTRRTTVPTGEGSKGDGDEPPRGLGLAVVQHLVSAAGGVVRAVSPRGLGARFDIELPVLSREMERGQPRVALGQVNGQVGRQVKRELPHLQQFSAQIEKEA